MSELKKIQISRTKVGCMSRRFRNMRDQGAMLAMVNVGSLRDNFYN